VFASLIELPVCSELGFDFVVARQTLALRDTKLFRRLAFREGEIVDAILGHDSSGGCSDARPRPRLASAFAAHELHQMIA
jgi:hypothetical protein